MSILEAQCGGCGETFNPADENDTEHGIREDGTVCGMKGQITGKWVTREEIEST